MIHYHGADIHPRSVLLALRGRHFCVSYAYPNDVATCHEIGQSVMLDNGAFTLWTRQKDTQGWSWDAYYVWVRPWLDSRSTWCVIPDVIGGTEHENDRLLAEWFACMGSYRQAAPVWHLHESFDRLDRLTRVYERVCFGSSGEYSAVGSDRWHARMIDAFNHICKGSGSPPCWIHMLRGMRMSFEDYPFASVDSADVARNHNRGGVDADAKARRAISMADRWDGMQCPIRWQQKPAQLTLVEVK